MTATTRDPIDVLALFRVATNDDDAFRLADEVDLVRAELAAGGFAALAWLVRTGHVELLFDACDKGRIPVEYAHAAHRLMEAEGRRA